ncbi:GerAB/ArcD/ProY family transporter [Paenibacillus sp. 2TAB23]|uniref:GerAB/ArcD/ProY family transporter n=1 Tax=Paenibacillus sp. 2TAB23 TaxID=3233004 RepID=UPI003F9BE583
MSKLSAITPTQLFAVIILFEFGTALVIPIGLGNGWNAWLSILLAMPGGIILYVLIVYFYKQYPSLILSGYIRKILGVYLGWPISLFYVVFFIYNGSRNLREAGDLLISASYDQTPITVVHATMIIAVIYMLYKGINVLLRLAEIFIIIMLLLGVFSNLAVILSGAIELRNLLPALGQGWASTIKKAYPNIFMFPFGELICFTTILPHLKQKKIATRTGIMAIVVSTILLSLTHAMEVSVIGSDFYSRSAFPLFTTITTVELVEFLQRLDALVILALIIGVFFKMSVYAYAASAMTADIFRISEKRKLAYPIGIIIFLLSVQSAWSFPEHKHEGIFVVNIILPILVVIIPLLLLFIHVIKKRLSHSHRV